MLKLIIVLMIVFNSSLLIAEDSTDQSVVKEPVLEDFEIILKEFDADMNKVN